MQLQVVLQQVLQCAYILAWRVNVVPWVHDYLGALIASHLQQHFMLHGLVGDWKPPRQSQAGVLNVATATQLVCKPG